MNTTRLITLVVALCGLCSCATTTLPVIASTDVSICSTDRCVAAGPAYNRDAVLQDLHQLLLANEGLVVSMCEGDKTSRLCKSHHVCHFVLGGILPGNGCSKSLTFSNVEWQEASADISMQTKMPLTFIGTPVKCVIAPSTISVNTEDGIRLELQPHFCSWMVVGAMTAKLELSVESINIERGEIAGYWKHSVTGTGNGRGSGYLILKFSKNIDWIAKAQ